MKRFFFCIFMALLCATGCQDSAHELRTDYSKIVFLSNRDAPKRQFDVFTMNLDGSEQINHTKDIESITSISMPVFSPDQNKVLFIAFENQRRMLRLLDIESGIITSLSDVDYDIPQASFSFQEDKILYVKKINGHRQIFTIKTDGTGEQNLSITNQDEFDASFSFDGKRIAFVIKTENAESVWVMKVDGTDRKKITEKLTKSGHPTFSPDGNKIVFHSLVDGRNDIYIHHLKSAKTEAVYTSSANNIKPSFSPAGNKLLFLSNNRGMRYQDVFVYDFKSKKTIVASNNINFINQNAMFSPDGKHIVFESVKFNNNEIYMVDSDGKNLTNLTNHEKWDCCPSF